MKQNRNLIVGYVLLASVNDSNDSQLNWNDTTTQDINSICSSIHDVQLGQNS